MKTYTKIIDGKRVRKTRNQIVLFGTRTIKDKDGNEKEIKTQIINPQEEMLLADGWEEYIEPTPTEEEQRAAEAQREIRTMRRNLDLTDYKVIKCLEAVLCGEEMPYDIKALHEEREGYRRIINENER